MDFFNRLSKLLLPAPCHLCGAAVSTSRHVCDACLGELHGERARCPICAIPVVSDDLVCGACLSRRPPFDASWAGMDFSPAARLLIHRLKYSGDLSVLADLVEPLVGMLVSRAERPEALIPVPIHPSRRRGRGFNQARLIADRLGRELHLPVLGDRVVRLRASDSAQQNLTAKMRRRQLRGAFAVTGPLPKHVAIVDDVMTTGSTVGSLASELKRAGVERVWVWVLARTPPPGR